MASKAMESIMNPTEPKCELLPCPFCGGDALVEPFWNGMHFVKCQHQPCNANISMKNSEAEAIAAWNSRPALAKDSKDERIAELEEELRVYKHIETLMYIRRPLTIEQIQQLRDRTELAAEVTIQAKDMLDILDCAANGLRPQALASKQWQGDEE